MKLTMTNGLLISSLKITHKGKNKILDGVIIDTGSAHTWINLDAVEDELDIAPEDGDQIVTSFVIGGRDVNSGFFAFQEPFCRQIVDIRI